MEKQDLKCNCDSCGIATIWVVVITVVITALVVGGVVFYLQSLAMRSIQTEMLDNQRELQNEITDLKGQINESEKTEVVQEKPEYKNLTYGFSLNFPESWGDVSEEILDSDVFNPASKIQEGFRLTSKNDKDRYIEIRVVKTEDKDDPYVIDTPHAFITENGDYSFYYVSAGDCAGKPGCDDQKYFDIMNEAEEISKTFKLLDDSEVSKKKFEIKSIDDTYNLYTNYEYGFSLKYPKEFIGYDVNVTQDDNEFDVEYVDGSGVSRGISFRVGLNIKEDSDLEDFIDESFGKIYNLGELKEDSLKEGVYHVGVIDDRGEKYLPNTGWFLKYSPGKEKIVKIYVGQDPAFFQRASEGSDFEYVSVIVGSFKFLD